MSAPCGGQMVTRLAFCQSERLSQVRLTSEAFVVRWGFCRSRGIFNRQPRKCKGYCCRTMAHLVLNRQRLLEQGKCSAIPYPVHPVPSSGLCACSSGTKNIVRPQFTRTLVNQAAPYKCPSFQFSHNLSGDVMTLCSRVAKKVALSSSPISTKRESTSH